MRTVLPLLLIGCAAQAPEPGEPACQECHGTIGAAPPKALGGFTDPTYRGVGAHTAHLEGTTLGVSIACDECHRVPTSVADEGHIDTAWPAEVIWGSLANAQGAQGVWNDDLTCTNVYCHTGAGATLPNPSWVDTSGDASSCTACHGNPPPSPHPQDSACATCHARPAEQHVDGILQLFTGGPACDVCHGANGDPAPPPALNGATDPSDPGVGAHATHLSPTLASPVPCADCHPVPTEVADPGHQDGTNDVVLLGLAASGGVTPAYDPGTQSCTAYCHDPGLDGTTPNPVWTDSFDGCGACHSMPPPAPHPGSSACQNCHSNAVAGGIGDPSTHIDGLVTF